MGAFFSFLKKKIAPTGIELELLIDAWRIGVGESVWCRARVLEHGKPMARLPWRKIVFTLVEAPSGTSLGIGDHKVSRAGEPLQRGIDSSGFARARLTAGNRPGKVRIKAAWSSKVNMVSLEKTYELIVAPAPEPELEVVEPEHILSLHSDSRRVPADASSSAMITARITDPSGRPIPYQKVSFYIEAWTEGSIVFDSGHVDFQLSNRDDSLNVIFGDGGGALLTRTDEQGKAQVKFTSGISRGVARICALHIQPGKVPAQKYVDISVGTKAAVSYSVKLTASPPVLKLEGDYSDLIADVRADGQKADEIIVFTISAAGGSDAYLAGSGGKREKEVSSKSVSGSVPRIVAGKKPGRVSVKASLARDPAISDSVSVQVALVPLLLGSGKRVLAIGPQKSMYDTPALMAPTTIFSIALTVRPPIVDSEGGTSSIGAVVSVGNTGISGKELRFSIEKRHGCSDACFLGPGGRSSDVTVGSDESGIALALLKFGRSSGKVQVRVSVAGDDLAYADTELEFSPKVISVHAASHKLAIPRAAGVFSVHILSGHFDEFTEALSAGLSKIGFRVVVFIPIDAPRSQADWDLLLKTYKPVSTVRGVSTSPFGQSDFTALFIERNRGMCCMVVADYSQPVMKDVVLNSAVDFLYSNKYLEVPSVFHLNGPFAMLSLLTVSEKYQVPCVFTFSGHKLSCVDARILSVLDPKVAGVVSGNKHYFRDRLIARELVCAGVADVMLVPSKDYDGSEMGMKVRGFMPKPMFVYNVAKAGVVSWHMPHDLMRGYMSKLLKQHGAGSIPHNGAVLFFPACGFDVLAGFDMVALGIPALVAKDPDVALVFWADPASAARGKFGQSISDKFDALARDYPKNVFVLKKKLSYPELAGFCAGSDFVVLPYVNAGAPWVAAMVSLFQGTPVIATSVGGLSSISRKGYLKHYFHPIHGLATPSMVSFFSGRWENSNGEYGEFQRKGSAAFVSAVGHALQAYHSGGSVRLGRGSSEFASFAGDFSKLSALYFSAYERLVYDKADSLARIGEIKRHLLRQNQVA